MSFASFVVAQFKAVHFSYQPCIIVIQRFSSGYATPDAYSNSHKSPCHSYNGDYQLTKRKVATDARSITSEKSETGNEWVEQDEPGVYLTIIYVQGVGKQLKRVRFR